MDFRTIIPVKPAPFTLGHQDHTLLLGSCFTEHIGARLQQSKFPSCINPYGIAYNPVSIADCLKAILNGHVTFQKEDLFQHGGVWRSWSHHSRFAQPEIDTTLKTMQEAYDAAVDFFKNSQCLMLTLGTAMVSTLKSNGMIVANNHKMPADHFDTRLLSVPETVTALTPLLAEVLNKIPGMKIILTVSPVRHLSHGMVENQRSKAVLVLACSELCEAFPQHAVYFPSYELLMDDLRDYRFYAPDMVHPSETAIEYIWQHFTETFFTPETQQINQQIAKIRTAAQHRPFQFNTPEHRAFQLAQLQKIEALVQQYPYLLFEAERKAFL